MGNLGKFYLFHGLIYFYLWLPTSWIYMNEVRGISPAQIALIGMVSWVVGALAQVPTGLLADVAGRRLSLAMGALVYAAGMVGRGLGHDFWWLMISGVIWVVGFSFLDGADSALLYDELAAEGRESEYVKVHGRTASVMYAAQAAGSLLGAPLAMLGMNLPYFACAGFAVLAAAVALSMKEPRLALKPEAAPKPSLREMLPSAVSLVRREPQVALAMLYVGFTAVVPFLLFYIFFQAYARPLGVPVAWMGTVLVALRLVTLGAASLAGRVTQWLGEAALLYGAPIAIAVLAAGMALTPMVLSLGLLALLLLINALYRPLVSATLNRLVESRIRATVLSLSELLTTLLFAGGEMGFGLVLDRWGAQAMLLGMAAFMALAAGGVLLVWRPGLRRDAPAVSAG